MLRQISPRADNSYDELARKFNERQQAAYNAQWNKGNLLQNYFFNGALDFTDVSVHTPWRLWIVYDMICAWGTNCDDNHPDSRYNHIVHNRGANDPFTSWEWGFGVLTLGALLIGACREYDKQKHKDYLNCSNNNVDFLRHQIEKERVKYFPDGEPFITNEGLIEDLNTLAKNRWKKLNQKKSLSDADKRAKKRQKLSYPPTHKYNSKPILDSDIQRTIELEIEQNHPVVDFFLQSSPLLDTIAKIYGRITNYSFTFWIVWMTAAGMLGIPLVNTALVVPVTLFAVSVCAAVYYIGDKLKGENQATPTLSETEQHFAQMQNENHLRLFFKNKHAAFKEKLKGILEPAYEQNKIDIERLFPKLYGKKDATASRFDEETIDSENRQNVFARFLAPSPKKKLLLNLISDMITAFTLATFTLWLLIFVFSTLGSVVAFTPFAGAASIINSALATVSNTSFSMAFGIFAAVIKGCYTYAAQTKANMIYAYTLEAKGERQAYKPHRIDIPRLNNRQAFNTLLAEVTQLNSKLSALQQNILQEHHYDRKKITGSIEKFIFNYRNDNIDISKDAYAETGFRPAALRLWDYVYKFIAGAQTWIFNVRNIGLPSGAGIFVSSIASLGMMFFAANGAASIFLGLAGIAGLIGGSLKVALHYDSEMQSKREEYLDKLNVRIGALRQAKVELTYLLNLATYLFPETGQSHKELAALRQESTTRYGHFAQSANEAPSPDRKSEERAFTP